MILMKAKPLLAVQAVDTFAIDIKTGDYLPDDYEPKDFSKAWRVTGIKASPKYPFRKFTLQRDKMIIDCTVLNEDKLSVFPKPKRKKTLRSTLSRDLTRDFLWLWFAGSLGLCAYLIGKGY